MYTPSDIDCTSYIKALADVIIIRGDPLQVHKDFRIPLEHAVKYLNKLDFLIGSTNANLKEIADVLNHDLHSDSVKVTEDELREIYHNKSIIDSIVEHYENEVSEKNNTIAQENNTKKENRDIGISDALREHNNEDHEVHDKR